MQKNLLRCLLLIAAGSPLVSHALTFDVRGGYKTGSHAYESRYKISESWANGWWASAEMDNKNNKNNGKGTNGSDKPDSAHSFGDSTTDYNELESNYTWRFADKWNLQPGGIYHWSSKGTQLRPYIRINYLPGADWSLGLRYRYDYNTYETLNDEGESHRDSVNRLDLFVGYKFNSEWSFLYQGTAYKHASDNYTYKNNKTWATENAFTLRYKWNKWFSPYVEYDYLDQQGYYEGEDNVSESRYRIGMTFTL
ncbi:oligogalacturonate-specific porin KdgM family protein [Enterobacter chengduensis]|uniref:oligogalacturonate-specific porin KdgM family protein n=1 Tax=Enterobacter chengduensis TaxID=2494701 RepID=UPI0020069266|nr:oligogalacturonate-specific porin KdgM family protein [Enterobacter chengduensis]MCK7451631.1 oligogalacturonate-specific porin KdgM family protein [Enterobacter chengduensis]